VDSDFEARLGLAQASTCTYILGNLNTNMHKPMSFHKHTPHGHHVHALYIKISPAIKGLYIPGRLAFR
jgi:hypothetical protein